MITLNLYKHFCFYTNIHRNENTVMYILLSIMFKMIINCYPQKQQNVINNFFIIIFSLAKL